MFTAFDGIKWRNCTQSRLVLGKLYTIAVFLIMGSTLNNVNKVSILFEKKRTLEDMHPTIHMIIGHKQISMKMGYLFTRILRSEKIHKMATKNLARRYFCERFL